ncbi:MAG: hypothetical protein WCO45_03415 [Pseudanabaena sp. ELA607]
MVQGWLSQGKQVMAQVGWQISLWGILTGIMATGCSTPNKPEATERPKTNIPVFLLLQASPNGKNIDAVVPSDLVNQQGSLDKTVKGFPENTQFSILRFGQTITTFRSGAVKGSDAFGAIASFKVQDKGSDPKSSDKSSDKANAAPIETKVLRQPNLVIVPTDSLPKREERNYFLNCPKSIQNQVLEKARPLFLTLGAKQNRLSQVSIASMVCADLDQDSQPEIIAGLRLDNLDRPAGMDPTAWQKFLSRPALERQEYSMLVWLRRPEGASDWQVEPVLTHTRALAYVNDSISSYALMGVINLSGGTYGELVVQEIGLNSVDLHILTALEESSDNSGKKVRWSSYYQNQRSLNIVQ